MRKGYQDCLETLNQVFWSWLEACLDWSGPWAGGAERGVLDDDWTVKARALAGSAEDSVIYTE